MRKFLFVVLILSIVCFCFSGQKSFAQRVSVAESLDKNKTDDAMKSIQVEFDKYLNQKDDSYQWKFVRKIGTKTSLLELTSQTWHGMTWKHYMLVVIPEKVKFEEHALVYIGAGANGREPKQGDILHSQLLAAKTMVPVVILFQVPNQPLDPANRGDDYYEDALIGETLIKVMETGDLSWALLLPMTKSVIRAMDASQEFIKQEYKLDVRKFLIGGASKRGWTTWLVGASQDPRVVGLVPIVYNNLNLMKQLAGHIETWGTFSPRIHDYIDRGLFKINEIPSPRKIQLMKLIDPYSYLARVKVPKLLIHGSNDPYWPVDSGKYYWDEIEGQKYMLTVPNAGHNIDVGASIFKTIDTAAAFTQMVASGEKLPKAAWKLTEKESQYHVSITTEIVDPKMTLWTAKSDSKNFQDAKWTSTPFQNNVTTIKKPTSGHIAFFIELESKKDELPFSFTTQVWRF
jgi:PhoPQ-activated pathogenicity-related protein